MGKKDTQTVRYVGRYDKVEVPLPDGGRAHVEHGEGLVTTPEHAASLLEQKGEWEQAKAAPEKEV